MVNLIDFFRKVKSIDIIYDPCCNNCLNGKVKYLGEITEVPQGIDCIFDKNIEHKFDYICELYERDDKFIAYNKSLENNN